MQAVISDVLANLPDKTDAVFETCFYHKNGEEIPAEVRGKILLDDTGNPIYFQGTTSNITERKQAEEALWMSEKKYRSMLDSIEEGYFEVDIAGNFTFVNDSECRILGYPRDELIGMNNRQYMGEKDAKKVYQGFNRIFKTGIPSKILDWELIRKDGTKLFVEISASLIKDSEGHPTGFRGILRDVTERKQAEKALRESEERFRILVEDSPLGISLIGKDGYYKYINPRFVEMFGYTLKDIPTGRVWFSKAYPDEEYRHQVISKWITDLEKFKHGEFRAQIFNVTCKDGSEKIIHFRPVTMETGDQFLIHEDITERKQAEKALKESEEKYRTILESIEDGYFEVDIAGNFTFVNDSECRILGYPRDELMGMNNREYMDQENAKKVYKKYNRIYKTGEPDKGFDCEYIRKDGTRRHAETSVSLIKDTEDNPIGFRGIFRDVTERKKIEIELIKTRNFLQNIFDSSTDGITTTDLQGNVIYTSPRVKDILGYEQEEIIGKKVYSLYGNGKEDAKTIMKEITEKGKLRDHDIRFKKKDDVLIDINISASLLRNEKGEIIGTLGIYRDITEKKKLEAQLQYSQRMEAIGTLAGGIAHNFNNLLMGMQGNVSMMLLDTDSDHPNYERLTNIEKMVQSGSKLTSQLLGYARGGRYEVRPISFNQLVKETSDTFDITKKDITVHQDIDKDLFGIIADQGQIEQVLLNLYVNAADAMPQGGDLFLKTVNVTHEDMKGKPYTPKPGNYALLTVRDTGVGMDKKTLDCIFDPFFTTKGLAKGTGLGLASVYGIIKAHGGYIDVYSEKGHGTTFYIYLPASEEKEVIEKEKLPEEVLKGKETVLLVDDEEMILDVGSQLLEKLGYKVLVAGSGKEAIEFYKANKDKIDMVILDMIMPEMGGGETYDRMKKIEPKIKVLLSSGYSIDGQATEILKKGCDGFIQKPFSMKELSQSIRKILDS
jgi:PAS domain S-box-containing protein